MLVYYYDLLVLPAPFIGSGKNVKKTEGRKELIKKLEKKYYLKAHKKIIKHRKNMQTDDTQKRMAEADKKARNFNRGNHLSWIEQQFISQKAKTISSG